MLCCARFAGSCSGGRPGARFVAGCDWLHIGGCRKHVGIRVWAKAHTHVRTLQAKPLDDPWRATGLCSDVHVSMCECCACGAVVAVAAAAAVVGAGARDVHRPGLPYVNHQASVGAGPCTPMFEQRFRPTHLRPHPMPCFRCHASTVPLRGDQPRACMCCTRLRATGAPSLPCAPFASNPSRAPVHTMALSR